MKIATAESHTLHVACLTAWQLVLAILFCSVPNIYSDIQRCLVNGCSCSLGDGLVMAMLAGYDISLTRAPIEPIK
jgi:hypothetical protein